MTWVRNGYYWVRNEQKVGTRFTKWYEMTWVQNNLGRFNSLFKSHVDIHYHIQNI